MLESPVNGGRVFDEAGVLSLSVFRGLAAAEARGAVSDAAAACRDTAPAAGWFVFEEKSETQVGFYLFICLFFWGENSGFLKICLHF